MNVLDHLEEESEKLTKAKEWFADDDSAGTDLPTQIIFLRQGNPVASSFVQDERGMLVKVLRAGCYAFSAEAVLVLFEAYGTELEKNPITELEWGSGEMQRLAEHYDGVRKGWVTTGVNLVGYDRLGNFFLVMKRYEITEDGLEWKDESITRSDDLDEVQLEKMDKSALHQVVLETMLNEPTLQQYVDQNLDNAPPGTELLSKEILEAAQDVAGLKFLVSTLENKCTVAFSLQAPPDSERARYISMSKEQFVDHVISENYPDQ